MYNVMYLYCRMVMIWDQSCGMMIGMKLNHYYTAERDSVPSQHAQSTPLIRLYVHFFLLMFQTLFRLSDKTMTVLFSFFSSSSAHYLPASQASLSPLFPIYLTTSMLLIQLLVKVGIIFESMFAAPLVMQYIHGKNVK